MLTYLLALIGLSVTVWLALYNLVENRLSGVRDRMVHRLTEAGWEDSDTYLARVARSTRPQMEPLGEVFSANQPGVSIGEVWAVINLEHRPQLAWVRRSLIWLYSPHAAALTAVGVFLMFDPTLHAIWLIFPSAFLAIEVALILLILLAE